MGAHNPEVFQELLAEFREGYAMYGDSAFMLEALSVDEEDSLPEVFKLALLDRVGSIATPWCQWFVWGSAGFPANSPNKEVYANVLRLSRSALKCFNPIARRAGAHLPQAIREAIPADPPDAHSWWTSLLWWWQIPREEDFGLRENCRRIVAVSPFEDSARVIEMSGLATDSPRMPFHVYLKGNPQNPEIVYESEDDDGRESPHNWIRVKEAELLSGINRGTISRACQSGKIRTNGETGGNLRIESTDFTRWHLEYARKQERGESEAAVKRKLGE